MGGYIHFQVGSMLINRVANTDLSWHKEWTAPRVSPHFDLTLDDKSVLRAIDQLNFIQMKRKQISFIIAIKMDRPPFSHGCCCLCFFRPVIIKLGGLKETGGLRIHFNFRFNWLGRRKIILSFRLFPLMVICSKGHNFEALPYN